MLGSCCICSEFTTGLLPPDLQHAYGVPTRPAITIAPFLLGASASPLSTPHILIFPERHVSRLSDLPVDQIMALHEIVRCRVMGEGRTCHSSAMIFEHGVTLGNGVACGIDHAHLHVLAVREPALSHVSDHVRQDYPPHATGTLQELLTTQSGTGSYLLYGSTAQEMHICRSASIPSQYMRRIIAEELGLESWDWRALVGRDAFRATADFLEGIPPEVNVK